MVFAGTDAIDGEVLACEIATALCEAGVDGILTEATNIEFRHSPFLVPSSRLYVMASRGKFSIRIEENRTKVCYEIFLYRLFMLTCALTSFLGLFFFRRKI